MATAKNVTVIPATRNLHTGIPTTSKAKRKVAGYARVSTDSDEQFTSYEAQVDYYTNYIKAVPSGSLLRSIPTKVYPHSTPKSVTALTE